MQDNLIIFFFPNAFGIQGDMNNVAFCPIDTSRIILFFVFSQYTLDVLKIIVGNRYYNTSDS